jgi:oxidoreductase
MGGTGAIGRHLIKHLAKSDQYKRISVLCRREFDFQLESEEERKKLNVQIINFDNPTPNIFKDHSEFFCCHGTTRRQAGSSEMFKRIDKDYVLKCAELFKEENSADNLHFLLVTSMGTNPSSSLLYPQTKGELERGIVALGFSRISIFRPGMLLGRPKDRFIEVCAEFVFSPFNFLLPGKFSIECESVAKSMLLVAKEKNNNCKLESSLWGIENPLGRIEIIENSDIYSLSNDNKSVKKL